MHWICLLRVSEIYSWWLIIEWSSLFCTGLIIAGLWGIVVSFYSTCLLWVRLSLIKPIISSIPNRWCLSSSNESRLFNSLNALVTSTTTGIHLNRFNLSACSLYNLQCARYSNGWLIWDTFLVNSCSHIHNLRITSAQNTPSSHIRHDCCSFSWSFSFCWAYNDGTFLCLTRVSLLLSFKDHFCVLARIVNALRLLALLAFFSAFFVFFHRCEYVWSSWRICDFLVTLR